MSPASHSTCQFQSCNVRSYSCNMKRKADIRPPVLEALEPRLLLSTYYWDPDGDWSNNCLGGDGLGGVGTWNLTSAQWWDGCSSCDVAWGDVGCSDAVFFGTSCGSAAGPVSLASGGITATSLTFETSGYTIQNNTLTLSGGSVVLDCADATISSVVAGSAGLSIPTCSCSSGGILTLSGANTYTGDTTITCGALRAINGTGLPTASNLVLAGGVLESSGTFSRTLGCGANQVRWSCGCSGGFAAYGGPLTVNLGSCVCWGSCDFVSYGCSLVFGSSTANDIVEFVTGIFINAESFGTIDVYDNTASSSDSAKVSGCISGLCSSLTKSGSGMLELTNSCGPNVAIYSGTLCVTSSGVESYISNNGQLIFDVEVNSSASYAYTISGSGPVTVTGGGEMTLSGANTFSGGLTVTDGSTLHVSCTQAYGGGTYIEWGTVVLESDDALPTDGAVILSNGCDSGTLKMNGYSQTLAGLIGTGSSGMVVNGACYTSPTLTLNVSSSCTFNGILGGTGDYENDFGLVKTGSGTQTLGGSNTYAYGTTIEAGTLEITAASLPGGVYVCDNAELRLAPTSDADYSCAIDGTGSVTIAGYSVVTLSSCDAFNYSGGTTISSGGTLRIINDAALPGYVVDDGQLIFAPSCDAEYSNTIEGSGSVTIDAYGVVVTLSGINTYTGGTLVDSGTLRVTTGSLPGHSEGGGWMMATLMLDAEGMEGAGADVLAALGVSMNRLGAANTRTEASATGAILANAPLTFTLIGSPAAFASLLEDAGTADTAVGFVEDASGSLHLVGLDAASNSAAAASMMGVVTERPAVSKRGVRVRAIGDGFTLYLSDEPALSGDSIATNLADGDFLEGTDLLLGGGMFTMDYSGSADVVICDGELIFDQSSCGENDAVIVGEGSGTVTATGGGEITLSGTIADDLSVTVTCSGDLTLSGSNTYCGTTTVESGGTLRVAIGSLPGDVTDNGTLIFENTSGEYGCSVNGTGLVIVAGGSDVTLSGSNTYCGSTTIDSGGTLRITNSCALPGSVCDNGALVFAPSCDAEYGSVVDGTGSVTIDGGYVVTLSGANTYSGETTVESGTLVITTGNQSSCIHNSGTLRFAPGSDVEYTGAIDGTGSVMIDGGYVVTLSGANTYTGSTTIEGGVLRVPEDGLAPGNLAFAGGVLETSGDFERNLGPDAGEVQWCGDGGFSAYDGPLTVSIGGNSTPDQLIWATNNFVPAGSALLFGSASAYYEVNFTNDIELGGSSRKIVAIDNPSCSDDVAKLSGILSGSGGLVKSGSGTLALTGTNTYCGDTTIARGALRADDGTALPSCSVLVLDGGVWEGNDTFTRTLGSEGNNKVRWASDGGFSAYGGPLTVNIGGNSTPDQLTWATNNFVPSGSALLFGSASAYYEVNFTNDIDLGGGSREFEVIDNPDGSGDVAELSGILSCSGGLVKSGSGTLALTGLNTYTGATIIGEGALRAHDGTGLPEDSNLVFDGGVLEVELLNVWENNGFDRSLGEHAGQVQWTGNGGFSAYCDSYTYRPLCVDINGGTTLIWGGPYFVPAGKSLLFGSSTANQQVCFNNGIDLNDQVGTVCVRDNADSSCDSATMNGVLSSGSLKKTGTGTLYLGTLYPEAANTYTGSTTVADGTLVLDGYNRLSAATTVILGDGTTSGTLKLNGYSQTLAGLETSGTGSGNKVINGKEDTSPTLTLNIGGSCEFAGILGGSVNNYDSCFSLVKTGPGTLTLSGVNTYTGTTTIKDGTLVLVDTEDALNPLPTGTLVTLGDGTTSGTLKLDGNDQTLAGLTTCGTGNDNKVINGRCTTATLTLNVSCNTTPTFAGVLGGSAEDDDNFDLIKTGSGTQVLSGHNTYTGATTIWGGALRADDDVGLPHDSNLVLAGGVLESCGCFTRGLGDGSNQVRWNGSGGFSASGGKLTVNIGGNDPVSCWTWGDTNFFVPDGYQLLFGSSTADYEVEFQNPIDLGDSYYNFRLIAVVDNACSGADFATLSGKISSCTCAGTALIKYGAGTLALSATDNNYSGDTQILGGALRANDEQGLPEASHLILAGGVLEGDGPSSFTRALGTTGQTVEWLGSGGFSAHNGTLTVLISGGELAWGSTTSFVQTYSSLLFGSSTANNVVDFQNAINLGSSSRVIEVIDNPGCSNDVASLSGVLSGAGSPIKDGAGTLILANSCNTYTGTTLVSSGVLQVKHNTLPGNVTDNAQLVFDQSTCGCYNCVISGSGSVTVTGGPVLTLDNANTYTGATKIQNDSTLKLGTNGSLSSGTAVILGNGTTSGTLQLNGHNQALTGLTTCGTCNGNEVVNDSTTLATLTLNIGCSSSPMTFAGILGGSTPEEKNFNLTKTCSGTLALTGNNTYTGATTISCGVLRAVDGTGLPKAVNGVGGSNLVFNGGVLESSCTFTRGLGTGGADVRWTCDGGFSAYGDQLTVTINNGGNPLPWDSGGFVPSDSKLLFGSSAADHEVEFTSAINLGSSSRAIEVIDNPGCSEDVASLSGVLSGAGSPTKGGAGTLILANSDNTYAGTTLVSCGVLQVKHNTLPGNVTDNAQLVFDQSTCGCYNCVISGSGSVTVQAGGYVLTLDNANTYAGTTKIQNGTVKLGTNGSLSSGTAVILGNGTTSGTLKLNGHSQALTGLTTCGTGSDNKIVNDSTTPVTLTLNVGCSSSPMTFAGILGGSTPEEKNFNVVKTGDSPLTLSGANTYSGTTSIQAGRVMLDGGDNRLPTSTQLTLAGTLDLNGYDQEVAGLAGTSTGRVKSYTCETATFTVNVATGNSCFNGVIEGNLNLAKQGSGTLELGGASTYYGTTDIKSGTIMLAVNNDRLPGGTTVRLGDTTSSGTLALNGHFQTLAGLEKVGGNDSRVVNGNATAATLTLFVLDEEVTFSGILGGTCTDDNKFGLTKKGYGTLALTGTNTYCGTTRIEYGALRANDTVGLPTTSHLVLAGGVLEGSCTSSFTRVLGSDTTAQSVEWCGDGGFSAYDGTLSVLISGGGVTWGGTNFVQADYSLLFGSPTANNLVDFQNSIDLNGGERTIEVADNLESTTDYAQVSGVLSNGSLKTGGGGLLSLSATNTYTGSTTIGDGTLRAAQGTGLPNNSHLIFDGGMFETCGSFVRGLGTSGGTVEWLGDGGFSAYGGTLTVNIGGSAAQLTWATTANFVPAGSVLLFGSATANNTVEILNPIALGSEDREVYVFNAESSSAELSGELLCSGGLIKSGPGTLILSAPNTYTGNTTVLEGTLQVDGSIASSKCLELVDDGTANAAKLTGTCQTSPREVMSRTYYRVKQFYRETAVEPPAGVKSGIWEYLKTYGVKSPNWAAAVKDLISGSVFVESSAPGSCGTATFECRFSRDLDKTPGFLIGGCELTKKLHGTAFDNVCIPFHKEGKDCPKYIVFGTGQCPVALVWRVEVRTTTLSVNSNGETSINYSGSDITVNITTGEISMPHYNARLGSGSVEWSNNGAFTEVTRAGNGWAASDWAQLVEAGGDRIAVDGLGTVRLLFDYDYSRNTYRPVLGNLNSLVHDAANKEFILTDTVGNVTRFYDFDSSLPKPQRGQFKGSTDAGGNVIESDYNTNGELTDIERYEVNGSTRTLLESHVYEWNSSSDPSVRLLKSATLSRKVGTGSLTEVSTTEYSYYGTYNTPGNYHGNLNDLKFVVTKQGGVATQTTYYRYYAGNGTSGLKYVFNGPSYARLVHDENINVDNLSDEVVAPYADEFLSYDNRNRLTKMVKSGTGDSGETNEGHGTYTYVYEQSYNPDGYNSWKTKTVETMPGYNFDTPNTQNTRNITYANFAGQTMLEVTQQWVSANVWNTIQCTFHGYDAEGREVLTAQPSAFEKHRDKADEDDVFYDEGYEDLLNADDNGHYLYLDDDAGLISVTDYYTDTTALEYVAGGAKGYVHTTSLKNGETAATAVKQTHADYIRRTGGGATIYPVYSSTVYGGDNGSGAEVTTFAYTWASDDSFQKLAVAVTPPIVTTAQNGSETSNTTIISYDSFGRPIWARDPEGFLSYTEYDPATGAVIKTIADVDTAQEGDFDDLPFEGTQEEWVTPSGGGLHLVTQYEVDDHGRTTKVTDPNGNVTYTVYNDVAHETRVYQGWNTSTHMPTGPTVVTRNDWSHGYSETLTMTEAPDLTCGLPNGEEAFTIGDIQTLSRSYTNRGGRVIETDQYYSFAGMSYSEDPDSRGSATANYLRTTYGYGAMGLMDRTQDPASTIRRTVNDVRRRAVSEWIGTDDTPTTGEWSPTNTCDTNLVMAAAYAYDDGTSTHGGDGNLTQSTTYADSEVSFATDYKYDWRNRRTGSRGPDNVATLADYDNLGEAVMVRTFADADQDFVIDVDTENHTTELRAKTQNDYDFLGRVYRMRVYEVNPASDQDPVVYLASNVWYSPRGLVIKTADPANLFAKTQYDGAGRAVASYTSYDTDETGYSAADDVVDDSIVNATFTVYSAARVSQIKTGTSAENAVAVQKYWYDTNGDGSGTSTMRLTGMSALKPLATLTGTSADYAITKYEYDAAGRQNVTIQPDPDGTGTQYYPTKTETTYDLLGRVTATRTYAMDGTEGGRLLTQTTNTYDTCNDAGHSAGQLDYSCTYEVPGSGDYLKTDYSYDSLGRMCKVGQPNGAFTKTLYNAYGRLLGSYSGAAEGSCTDPTTLTDDIIVSQTLPSYDAVNRVWLTQSFQRDGSGSGALTTSNARVTYGVYWFDDLGRTKWAADYGTNDGDDDITSKDYDFDGNGSTYTDYEHANMPTRTTGSGGNAESYILTQYQYDGYGRQNVVIDNAGHVTRTYFDAAGRKTHIVENFTDFAIGSGGSETGIGGGSNNDQDRVTKFVYDDAGLLTQQIALAASSGDNQVTTYIYAIDLDADHAGCPVPDNSRLRAVAYPDGLDPEDVIAAINDDDSGDFVETIYNAAGLTLTSTDQRGVVHTYTYDDLGRLTRDAATTIPTGVADDVKSVTYAYDDLGRTRRVTSWENADGTGDIRSDLVYEYDGWGNVATAWQSHSGAAVTTGDEGSRSPHVHYFYDDGEPETPVAHAAPYVRLASVTYPDGTVVHYNYGTQGGIDDALSRLNNIASSATPVDADKYAAYTYLGAGTVVEVDHPALASVGGLTLTYGSAGNYTGFDRFGRVIDQTWQTGGETPTALDRYQYAYDMNSNRTSRDNLLDGSLDEDYAYDCLDRLVDTNRGGDHLHDWTLDALGNWNRFIETDGETTTLDQTRDNDAANQINDIEASVGDVWITPEYDAAGNMVVGPMAGYETTELRFVYNAWNRLVKVTDDSQSPVTIAEYRYDGQGRRIAKAISNSSNWDRTDYYLNESQQILDERFSGNQSDKNAVATTVHVRWLWDPRYVDSPVLRWRDADNDTNHTLEEALYFTTDANNNVTALVKVVSGAGRVVERYMYDAYGKVTVLNGEMGYDGGSGEGQAAEWSADADNKSDWGNEVLYAGYRLDAESGMFQVRNRNYHPTLGRWIERDSAGYVDGISLYQYCRSNPANAVDPTGLQISRDQTTPDWEA